MQAEVRVYIRCGMVTKFGHFSNDFLAFARNFARENAGISLGCSLSAPQRLREHLRGQLRCIRMLVALFYLRYCGVH